MKGEEERESAGEGRRGGRRRKESSRNIRHASSSVRVLAIRDKCKNVAESGQAS